MYSDDCMTEFAKFGQKKNQTTVCQLKGFQEQEYWQLNNYYNYAIT